MAERRMFAKTIIDSDAFLEMPQSTQLLYFHLAMRADDDGFINNPKSIMRTVGSKDDDIRVLASKKFIIPFESGVVVIKHWKIHNYIQNDRYKATKYCEEKSRLSIKPNKSYSLESEQCINNVSILDTQVRLGKVRLELGKDNMGSKSPKATTPKTLTPPTLTEIEAYCKERNSSVNAKVFFDYFTEGGWVDSKGNKVRNWKQKLITWEKHQETKANQKTPPCEYDFSKYQI